MLKKTIVTVAVVGLLVAGATTVMAQGNGRGPAGRGGNNDVPPPACTGANCIAEPQTNTYNYSNQAQTQPRNVQQRGWANRGLVQPGQFGPGLGLNLPPAFEGDLPQEIVDLMQAGWLDEQHAYAVYASIMEQFGEIAPFVNIQQAEAQHAAAWEFMFERYSIPVPELPVFDIPRFATVQEACAEAAEAEIANFDLYDAMLAAFEPYPDLYQVTLNLRNVSEFNHLPALQNCAGS